MDLTILIPTYNRHELIKKLLSFYELSKFKGNIIIIDSSENEILIKTRLLIKKFKKIKVEYVEYKNDAYSAKCKVFDKIKTKYVVQSGDDDYYFSKGLVKIIRYLNKNSHLKYAVGDGVFMTYDKNIIHRCWYYKIPFYKDDTILKRLKKFSLTSKQLMEYSVYKTDTFKKVYFYGKWKRNIIKADWNNLNEINSNFSTAIHGPGNHVPSLYLARTELKNLEKESRLPSINRNKFDKEFKKWRLKILFEIKKYDSSEKTLDIANKKMDLIYSDKVLLTNKNTWGKTKKIFQFTIKNYFKIIIFRLRFKKRLHQVLLDKKSSLFNTEFEILSKILLKNE